MPRRLALAASSASVRGEPVEFEVNGRRVRGFSGESLAAAALAAGETVLGRSLKYHRPRGAFCFDGHCSGCVVRVDGVPNLHACQIQCRDGSVVEAQNAFPHADSDLLGAVDFVFGRGLNHHTLMTQSTLLNRLANKVVRHLSGLGTLPTACDTRQTESAVCDVDVCIIGGGPAGLAAAEALGTSSTRILIIDDQPVMGGSLWATPGGEQQVQGLLGSLASNGAHLMPYATAIGFYPDANEAPTGSAADGTLVVVEYRGANQRFTQIRARRWIWATGGSAANLLFANNDRPGVIAMRALARLLHLNGIVAGDRVAIVVPSAHSIPADHVRVEAARIAQSLSQVGCSVAVVEEEKVSAALGTPGVNGLALRDGTTIDVDLIAVAAIPAPASEGPRQHACEVEFQQEAGGFAVRVDELGRTSVANVWAAGDVCGYVGTEMASRRGHTVGLDVSRTLP